ncbi:MAG TPA: erythromycin esterase family protein [Ktedonobacteraceae bacterium]|nr:erythromycin esterase family protein [Ktedonobacteraceae bacterium]
MPSGTFLIFAACLKREKARKTREIVPCLRNRRQKSAFPDFLLPLRAQNQATQLLSTERLERAIGVVYRPQSERISHYFSANLPAQFDLVLHFDQTHAVEPLDNRERWERGEVPETYPTAL